MLSGCAATTPTVVQHGAEQPADSNVVTSVEASTLQPGQLLSKKEMWELLDSTVAGNKDLQGIMDALDNGKELIMYIDREPDEDYSEYIVYVGADMDEHSSKLFNFVIDAETRVVSIEWFGEDDFVITSIDDYVRANREYLEPKASDEPVGSFSSPL
jgi:hypothetical protein